MSSLQIFALGTVFQVKYIVPFEISLLFKRSNLKMQQLLSQPSLVGSRSVLVLFIPSCSVAEPHALPRIEQDLLLAPGRPLLPAVPGHRLESCPSVPQGEATSLAMSLHLVLTSLPSGAHQDEGPGARHGALQQSRALRGEAAGQVVPALELPTHRN